MAFSINIEKRDEGTLIHVDGQLLSRGVRELRSACDAAAKPIALDLTRLDLADSNGVKALKALEAGGAHLMGIPQHISRLLHHMHMA